MLFSKSQQEDPMRPLLQLPKWDGKLVLAGLFFLGYYSLVWTITRHDIPPANVQLIRDQLLVLGPGVGLILGAIYRNTAAEERKAANDAQTLQKAIETPTTIVAPEATANAVENGARDGTRAGVNDALDNVSSALSERTDEPELLK